MKKNEIDDCVIWYWACLEKMMIGSNYQKFSLLSFLFCILSLGLDSSHLGQISLIKVTSFCCLGLNVWCVIEYCFRLAWIRKKYKKWLDRMLLCFGFLWLIFKGLSLVLMEWVNELDDWGLRWPMLSWLPMLQNCKKISDENLLEITLQSLNVLSNTAMARIIWFFLSFN